MTRTTPTPTDAAPVDPLAAILLAEARIETVDAAIEAFAALRTRADEGGAAADQWLVGHCLAQGKGTSADHFASIPYFRLAADQGHVDAQFQVGFFLCYFHRFTGAAENRAEILRYFRLAADQGHRDAQYHLALYLDRNNAVGDRAEALRYLRMAADQGHAQARENLGLDALPQN